MTFYQALCVRGDGHVYTALTSHMQVDLAYVDYESKETLTTLILCKSSHLGPKTLTNVFSTQRALFQGPPMVKNSPLNVLTWIRMLGLDFKDSIAPYGLSCVFPYHQIRVDEPLLHVAINYWVPTRYVFCFN